MGRPTGIEALPEAVLEHIFFWAASGRGAASPPPTLPLVCHRWRRVYHTSRLLFGTLNLNLASLEEEAREQAEGYAAARAGLLRLLALRGRAARRLWVHSEGQELRLAPVLELMSPHLQQVFIGQLLHSSNSLQLLQPFSRSLRALDLPAAAYQPVHAETLTSPAAATAGPASGCLAVPPAALLGAFQQLEELALREGVSGGLMAEVAALPRLRLLSLVVAGPLPPGFHSHLASLAALEELDLRLQSAAGPVVCGAAPLHYALQPGELSGLARLRTVYIAAGPATTLGLGPGLSRLAALQDLRVKGSVQQLPADMWECQQLKRLRLSLFGQPLEPLPPQLALPVLQELRLTRCRLPGGVLPAVLCQLGPSLRELALRNCGMLCFGGVPPEFAQLTSLECLSLEGNGLGRLPSEVAALPRLRRLDASCNMLTGLPRGAYLASLHSLTLSNNRLARVPPALAGASRLEVLDLTQNPQLEVAAEDVRAIFMRMLRLNLLLLGKQPGCGGTSLEWSARSEGALVNLGQRLPRLQVDFEHTEDEFEDA